MAQNPLMPYVEIDSPLSMSDEKFSEILEKNKDLIIELNKDCCIWRRNLNALMCGLRIWILLESSRICFRKL